MNNTILFFIALLFFSCDLEFDTNVRVESLGKVVDENNTAIPNVFVGVYTEGERFTGFYPSPAASRDYLLGSGFSDVEGVFSVTSLFDSDQDFFIFIDGQGTHTDYIYSANTYTFEPENFAFNLGMVALKKKALVNINITRVSAAGTTLEFFILYDNPFCEEVYENGVRDEASSNCFRATSLSSTLNDENPEYMITLSAFVTGTIQFSYTIDGGTQTTETFVINEENYEINFSY